MGFHSIPRLLASCYWGPLFLYILNISAAVAILCQWLQLAKVVITLHRWSGNSDSLTSCCASVLTQSRQCSCRRVGLTVLRALTGNFKISFRTNQTLWLWGVPTVSLLRFMQARDDARVSCSFAVTTLSRLFSPLQQPHQCNQKKCKCWQPLGLVYMLWQAR